MRYLNYRQIALTVLMAALTAAFGGGAEAAGIAAFDHHQFAEAQKAGKSIVVDVHADWCPVCKKQAPILEKLSSDKAFSGVAFFRLNFDSEKEILKQWNVEYQSTILVFKGSQEKARSTGDTDQKKIRALIEKGL